MRKPEILPPVPRQNNLPDRPRPPTYGPTSSNYNSPNAIDAFFVRLQADRDTKTLGKLTERNNSALALYKTETDLINEAHRRHDIYAKHQDAEEERGQSRALRRLEYGEQLDAAYHTHIVNQGHREVDLTKLQVVLTDARQELEAQVEHGGKHYALVWQKRLLDAELEVAAKREMIRQLREPEQQPTQATSPDDIMDVLVECRAVLNAAGGDTSRIDAMIRGRKR